MDKRRAPRPILIERIYLEKNPMTPCSLPAPLMRVAWAVSLKAVLKAGLIAGLMTVLIAGALPIPEVEGAQPLPVLARVGPWPAVSQLVGYRGKLWFANSVKGVNHNSADLYTYDPGTGGLRYERHLFSQDAGDPVVAGGLLYWPLEDSRFSLGWGQFMVTNGQGWELGTIPTAQIFHTHALARQGQRLVAATSAWRGGLQVSSDRGISWRAVYDHPTQRGRVSRIVTLATLSNSAGDTVIGYIKERRDGKDLRRLLRLREYAVIEVPGWPQQRSIAAMAAHQGSLYAAVILPEGIAIWRTDGNSSEAMTPPRRYWRVQGMASGPEGLWVVTGAGAVSGAEALPGADATGQVWFSADGVSWKQRYSLAGGEPRHIAIHGGRPYVGGEGADGRGILWGPARPVSLEAVPLEAVSSGAMASEAVSSEAVARVVTALPSRGKPAGAVDRAVDWEKASRKLERAIREAGKGDARGRKLRDLVYRYALSGPPRELISGLLARTNGQGTVSLFHGKVNVAQVTYVRWILLWGMGISGQGAVPLELITLPWRAPQNYPEKYFESPPAAMWAAAMVKQDGRETIAALIERLGRVNEPMWLKGDAVGALTVLTGQRFAYDFAAWRNWWRESEPEWRR